MLGNRQEGDLVKLIRATLTPPQGWRLLPPRTIRVVADATRQVVRTRELMICELGVCRGADSETETEEQGVNAGKANAHGTRDDVAR